MLLLPDIFNSFTHSGYDHVVWASEPQIRFDLSPLV